MESTDGKSKKQAMADLSPETSENPKPDQVINSSDSKQTSPPMAAASKPPSEDHVEMEQVEEQAEYVCRYCRKKFNNKQALGGHQNAHKVERALEKSAKESAKAAAARAAPGYLSADFYSYPNLVGSHYYPNSFSRYHDRFFPYSIPPPPPPPYPHTFMPMPADPFAPRMHPSPTNNYHAGWSRPLMAARPPMRMQNPGGNPWLAPPPPPPQDGGVNGAAAWLRMSAAGASSSSGVVNADNNGKAELDLTLKL